METPPTSTLPKLQLKIDAMQKYVPFLNKTIAKLQQQPHDVSKLKQMELYYKFLQTPEPAASFEDLVECEEVLVELYTIYEKSVGNNETESGLTVNESTNEVDERSDLDATAHVVEQELTKAAKVVETSNEIETKENENGVRHSSNSKEMVEQKSITTKRENTKESNVFQHYQLSNASLKETPKQECGITTRPKASAIPKEDCGKNVRLAIAENQMADIDPTVDGLSQEMAKSAKPAETGDEILETGDEIDTKEKEIAAHHTKEFDPNSAVMEDQKTIATKNEHTKNLKLTQFNENPSKTNTAEPECVSTRVTLNDFNENDSPTPSTKPKEDVEKNLKNYQVVEEDKVSTTKEKPRLAVDFERAVNETTEELLNGFNHKENSCTAVASAAPQNQERTEDGMKTQSKETSEIYNDHQLTLEAPMEGNKPLNTIVDSTSVCDSEGANYNYIPDVEDELEGNVELIKFPSDEEDDIFEEMILPDAAQPMQNIKNSNDNDNADDDEEYDDEANKEQTNDILNIGLESSREQQQQNSRFDEENKTLSVDETATAAPISTQDGYDPLHCEATNDALNKVNKIVTKISGAVEKSIVSKTIKEHKNVDDGEDDDDDVMFVETRNSPICIDSNDEEDDVDASNISALPLPAKQSSTPATAPSRKEHSTKRTIARKSTAKSAVTSEAQRNVRPLHESDAEMHVVDTIELLDSSDDDGTQGITAFKNKNASTTASPISSNKRRLLPTFNASAFSRNFNITNNCKNKKPNLKHIALKQMQKRTAVTNATATQQSVYVSTPKSNFLNAINLQPINNGSNDPIAFSAKLFDKNVMIPNAFYGNRPEMRNAINPKPTVLQRGRPRLAVKQSDPPTMYGDEDQIQLAMQCLHRRWLESFLRNFANPQQVATQECFVLLQRVLKYKMFMRLKEQRVYLNENAQTATEEIDMSVFLNLHNAFFRNNKELSDAGRRFCQQTISQSLNESITLTIDLSTGRVTSRTRTARELTLERESFLNAETAAYPQQQNNKTAANNFNGIFVTATAAAKKRQYDDVEYMPGKAISLPSNVEGSDISGERKKSLRTKRTRRYDNSFSYNEEEQDDFDDETDPFEIAKSNYGAVQRKVEEKRLEAKLHREQQVKSFENAFIATFTKTNEEKAALKYAVESKGATTKRLRKQNFSSYTENRHAYDLLTPTFTGNIVNDTSVSQQSLAATDQFEEPREHRIYKVIPTKLMAAPTANELKAQPAALLQVDEKKRNRGRPRKQSNILPEIITCDIDSEDNSNSNNSHEELVNIVHSEPAAVAPKNTNRDVHATSRNNEYCVICKIRASRIVHHYVNKHRGCEVYTSRLSETLVKRLRAGKYSVTAEMSMYKNGQMQFQADCLFCRKKSRFMLPYWYQHFTMHTGEYAYRCTGCGIRKPTRSLLSAHTNQPCPRGGGVLQDFAYDPHVMEIEAHICTLCNFVQLNRSNVERHVRTEHNRHLCNQAMYIETIVLLSLSEKPNTKTAIKSNNEMMLEMSEVDDSMNRSTGFTSEWSTPTTAGTAVPTNMHNDNITVQSEHWDDGDPCNDLSYMICGMLDVEMHND